MDDDPPENLSDETGQALHSSLVNEEHSAWKDNSCCQKLLINGD